MNVLCDLIRNVGRTAKGKGQSDTMSGENKESSVRNNRNDLCHKGAKNMAELCSHPSKHIQPLDLAT